MDAPVPGLPPVAAFHGAGRTAQALGALLRSIHAVSPGWGTRAALGLFFTPVPWKLATRRPMPAAWARASWSFEGASLTAYRRRDVPPGRPNVLLLHGWAGSGLQLHSMGEALAQAGFDPVLLDFPAHGRSLGWRTSLPQFTRALHAAHARLGPLHAVVAHSLGALAALHGAASGLAVQRLALLAPAAPPGDILGRFTGGLGLPHTAVGRMRAYIERREGVPFEEFEPEWLGPRVNQPTLVVHDEADRVVPLESAHRMAGLLRHATWQPTNGLGHNRLLRDPEVSSAVVHHLAQAS